MSMTGETMTINDQIQQGKGTPLSKQAKRDKESAKHWKKSSIEKTEMVKAERRMKEEARKQRDRIKEESRAKDAEVKTHLQTIQEMDQLYKEEQQKRIEEEKKREKAEKALAKITKQLEDTDEKLREFIETQASLTTQIFQTHLDVNNHLYEQHQAETKDSKEKRFIPKEILENKEKIGEQISGIEKSIQEMSDDLKQENINHRGRWLNFKQTTKKK